MRPIHRDEFEAMIASGGNNVWNRYYLLAVAFSDPAVVTVLRCDANVSGLDATVAVRYRNWQTREVKVLNGWSIGYKLAA